MSGIEVEDLTLVDVASAQVSVSLVQVQDTYLVLVTCGCGNKLAIGHNQPDWTIDFPGGVVFNCKQCGRKHPLLPLLSLSKQ